MNLRLDQLQADPKNLRRAAVTAQQEQGLRASMRQVGVLIPLLVRANEDGSFTVLDGHRRLRAASDIGLEELPVRVEERTAAVAPSEALQAAANMARAGLSAIDQWRAVSALRDAGFSIEGAADAMGQPVRMAKRMQLLSKLHPPILEAIEATGEMPRDESLRDIASADPKKQAAAWKAHGKQVMGGGAWWQVAHACRTSTIPKRLAKFDDALARKHKVRWQEDLFAEPDDDDAVFTADVAGFLKAQRAWLDDVQLPGMKAQGYQAEILEVNKDGYARAPKGMEGIFAKDPEKAPKTVIRGYWIDRDGQLRTELYKRPKPPAPATKGKPDDQATASKLGGAEPTAAGRQVQEGGGEPAEAGEGQEATLDALPAAPGRHPLSNAGRTMVANARTDALRAALRGGTVRDDHQALLRALLAALAADNVKVGGTNTRYSIIGFQDLAVRLINEDGSPRMLASIDIAEIAAEALARMLGANQDFRFGGSTGGSGPVFDWCARILGIERPRFDTEEILEAASLGHLRDLAKGIEVKASGKGKPELVRLLAGQLPDWCPPGGAFDAVGPARGPADDMDGPKDEEAELGEAA